MIPTSLSVLNMNKQSFERLADLLELPINAEGVIRVLNALENGETESLAQLVEEVEISNGCLHQVRASTVCRFDKDTPVSLKHTLTLIPCDGGPTIELTAPESRVDLEIRWDSGPQIDDEERDGIWREVATIANRLGIFQLPKRLCRDDTSWPLAVGVTLGYRAPEEQTATAESLVVPKEHRWTPERFRIKNFETADLLSILRDLGVDAESALGRPALSHLVNLLPLEESNFEAHRLKPIQRNVTLKAELRIGIGDEDQIDSTDLEDTPADVVKRLQNGWYFTLSDLASDLGPVRLELGSVGLVTQPNGEHLINRQASAALLLLGSDGDPQGACAALKLASYLRDRTGTEINHDDFTRRTGPDNTSLDFYYWDEHVSFTVELRKASYPITGISKGS
jgi:hypothetical protein